MTTNPARSRPPAGGHAVGRHQLARRSGRPVAVEGSIVYSHRFATGHIEAIDFRDPMHPELVAWFDVPGRPSRVVVSGGHAYAMGSGLSVVRFLVAPD